MLSDISALRYQYRYEYKKLYHHKPLELTDEFYVRAYISFDDWKFIPRDKFEWIEEWHANADRKYLVGVLAFKELRENQLLTVTDNTTLQEKHIK